MVSLFQSLASWEVATEVILERESLMTKLEDFERTASDPNRFFVKGNMRLISNRKFEICLGWWLNYVT